MKMIASGLELFDMPAAEYHASDAVGHSALVKMCRSPAHYKHYRDTAHAPTPAMEFGSAMHMAVLEPELFCETYTVSPKFDRRTTEGKAQAAQWDEQNLGKKALTQEVMELLENIQRAIGLHSTGATLVRNGRKEMSFFWTDAETGIACKFRPDVLLLDGGEAVTLGTALELDALQHVIGQLDLKSTRDAERNAFRRDIFKLGYDIQAAYYSDPLSEYLQRPIPFKFLAVESAAPHGVALYGVGERLMQIGRSKYRAALQLLQWCRERDEWPSYQPFSDEDQIEAPTWEKAIEFDDDDDQD